jgi:alpha-galactosidase
MHGVVAADGSQALMCHVQLDVPATDQPAALRIPGLDPARRYRITDVTPGEPAPGDAGGGPPRRLAVEASGAALAEIGLAIPARHPLRATVFHVTPATSPADAIAGQSWELAAIADSAGQA